ncbi:methyltransferase [Kitasatospora sp. NPDC059747]|uniref:methyltransferase n=1 Tax=Kitasatospora sp. NPDC059747 TaxID=3346930 RepID=UPI00366690F5
MSVDTVTGGPPDARSLPAPVRLILLTNGRRISEVLHVVAELRIADLLADHPRTVAELAGLTDSHEESLYRVLRCAAAFGLVTEEEDRRFAENELTVGLRSDIPFGVRDLVLYNGSESVRRPYGEILHTVRTGRPAFEHVFGRPFFAGDGAADTGTTDTGATQDTGAAQDDVASQDDVAAGEDTEPVGTGALFDRAMTQMSRSTTHLFTSQYDFTRFSRIADIGGGQGFFLSAVLNAVPGATGVLLDRPHVVKDAAHHLAEAGVAERVSIVPGSFFHPLPADCDAYLLKQVLHDWDDEHAVRILRGVRDALGDRAEGRLLVLDHVVAGPNEWDQGKFLDVDMMLRFGGRERTLREWQDLLTAADFALANRPATGRWAVLEARPLPRARSGRAA